MNEHVDYRAKEAHKGTKFLWWCAGADPLILKYSSYSDHIKYVGIGAVVLATGFLAFISMSFALYIVFQNDEGESSLIRSVIFGFAWGLIIFNLDRFIVSSTGKGDGKETISLSELLNAAPRLLMAVILGLAIATPLEVYIFRTEIQRVIDDMRDKDIQLVVGKVETKYQTQLKRLEDTYDQKRTEKQRLDDILEDLRNEYLKEANIVTCGPRCQAKLNELNRFKDGQHAAGVSAFEESERNLDSIKNVISVEIQKTQESIRSTNAGFLDRVLAIHVLTEEPKKVTLKDPVTGEVRTEIVRPSAWWPVWIVRFLFMVIEIAPVLLKLMLIKSPYDYMTENVHQIIESKQGISIEHLPDQHSKIHKLKRNHNPERIIKVVEHLNEKELQNAKKAIDAFASKQKSDIQENPENYVSDGSGDV